LSAVPLSVAGDGKAHIWLSMASVVQSLRFCVSHRLREKLVRHRKRGRSVEHLRNQGRQIPDEVLKHISPLGWEHINLTGIYSWDERPDLIDGFRPLRVQKGMARAA
jgi:hypothetical protein